MSDEQKQLWWDQIEPLNVPVERRWRSNEPRYPYRRKSDREALAAAEKNPKTPVDDKPLEPWQLFNYGTSAEEAPQAAPVPEASATEPKFDPTDLSWANQPRIESPRSNGVDDDWNAQAFSTSSNNQSFTDGFSFSSDLDTVSEGMPWRELGLTSNATWAEVVDKYRELVKAHHPDRHGSNDAEARKAAEEKMAAINAAFDDLNEIYRLTGDA